MLASVSEMNPVKNNQSICFLVTEESYIGAARRKSLRIAQTLGFSSYEMEKIAIIVNELGSNLIKHNHQKKTRQLLFHFRETAGRKFFELMALDKGPGILSVTQALQDGY